MSNIDRDTSPKLKACDCIKQVWGVDQWGDGVGLERGGQVVGVKSEQFF